MVNAKSYVRIAEDKTEAWLYLCAPEDGSPYEKHEVMRYLQLNGVKAGINESHVAAMCRKQIYEREVKIATSEKGDPGEPARYDFFFDTEKPRPTIRPDGTADYRSMSLVQNVTEGELLALYHPPVQGTSGRDVTGAFSKPTIHKELKVLSGKGIERSEEDPNKYYATKSGKIELDRYTGQLSVVEVYEIHGSCDYTTNSLIEFNGDVVIYGNVEAGVIIKVGKSLTVEGVVESAYITAGGDVCLKRGMQGGEKGYIEAGGDVFAEFIEYTKVKAKGSVQSNVILSSKISADNKVILTGRKGLIAGGKVHAMMGIECQIAGNQSEIRTLLHIGVMPEIMEQRINVTTELNKLNEELDQIVETMAKIMRVRQQSGGLTEQLEEHLNSLKKRKNEIYAQNQEVKKRIAELDDLIFKSREAKIRISGSIFKGTIISIDDHQYAIAKDTGFMEYSGQNGSIAGTVIVV
jgi:uncharacterized protein (DUF342 family)